MHRVDGSSSSSCRTCAAKLHTTGKCRSPSVSVTSLARRRTALSNGELPALLRYSRADSSISSDLIRSSLASTRSNKARTRSEEHTSELQSPDHLVCRLLLEKKKHIS